VFYLWSTHWCSSDHTQGLARQENQVGWPCGEIGPTGFQNRSDRFPQDEHNKEQQVFKKAIKKDTDSF
jgi:hypothetical protein